MEVAHPEPGLAVVTMRGEHDLGTIPVLRPAFEQATAHSNVLVDLSDCAFIDSTVIALLVRAVHVVQARGEKLALVIPPNQPHVAGIAAMTGLSEFFGVHVTRDRSRETQARQRLGMNGDQRARWFEPSPPLPVDGEELPPDEPPKQEAPRRPSVETTPNDPIRSGGGAV